MAVWSRLVNEVLATADKRAYQAAIRYLKAAKKAATAADAMVESDVRVAGLRETHRRRPSLIARLDCRLGVEVPRSHDLVGLHRLLPESFQAQFGAGDLEVLNPWTIEGRYPADLPDADRSVIEETLAAARRILDASTGDV